VAAGGNLAAGIPMVLLVLIVTALVAFIETDSAPDGSDVGCTYQGNSTTCEGGDVSDYMETFFDVSVTGLDGAPAWFNGFYVIIMAGVLVGGFALIISGMAGSIFGGG
jgi:hypothetical protein